MPSARDELEGRLYVAIMQDPRNRNIPIANLTKGLGNLTMTDHRKAAAGVVQDLRRRGVTAKVEATRTNFVVTLST